MSGMLRGLRERLPIATPLVIFVLIALLDPFALYSASNKVSRELAFRALSLWQEGQSRNQVAVVLLDDASADALNGEYGYPITFQNHAEIVRTILCAGPASLFIDFTFRNIRTRDPQARARLAGNDISADLDDFIRALTMRAKEGDRFCAPVSLSDGRTSSGGTRVYTARTRSIAHDNCDPLFEGYPGAKPLPERCRAAREVANLATVTEPLTLARADLDGAYLVVVPPAATYALIPEGVDARQPVERSPALAAVLAFCAGLPPDRAAQFRGCRERVALDALLAHPDPKWRLTPMWGYYRVGSATPVGLEQQCKRSQIEDGSSTLSRLGIVFGEIGRALVRGQTDKESELFGKGLCLPFEAVTAADLINRGADCGGRDRATCRLEQAAVTAGRMVFYGASVADVHDVVESPVLGVVPGVAVHAAAAVNLLQHGTAFVREPPELDIPGLRLDGSQVYEIGLLVVWFVLLVLFRPVLLVGSGGGSLRRRLAHHLFISIVSLGLALGATAVAYAWFFWSPANWLGLAVALASTRPDASPKARAY